VDDYYRVLGVPRTATNAEIRTAYIDLVRSFHPDRLGAYPDPSEWKAANERLAGFNEAFSVLGDPVKRQEYDAVRTPQAATPHTEEQVAAGRAFIVVLGSSLGDRAKVIKALLDDYVITGYYSYLSNCIFCTSWKTAEDISSSIVSHCAPSGGAVFLVAGISGEWGGRLPRAAWEFLEKNAPMAGRRRS
jgi:hypothetical protein